MIKFFRKIRYNLIEKNLPTRSDESIGRAGKAGLSTVQVGKTGKYLIYALGEIILVVIGILIALQINNWNEQKKDDKLEREYYCRLLEDVTLDKEQIDVLLLASQDRLKASNQAARLLQKDQVYKIEVGEQISLSIRAIYTDFKPNDAAFVDLKSGANLNIIKDKSIISALNNYFNKVEGYISIIQVNGENAVKVFYAHDDIFESGWVSASMKSGCMQQGTDPDVLAGIPLNETEVLSDLMKYRLYNEALLYISHNQRQIILYNSIKDETKKLIKTLEIKCTNPND